MLVHGTAEDTLAKPNHEADRVRSEWGVLRRSCGIQSLRDLLRFHSQFVKQVAEPRILAQRIPVGVVSQGNIERMHQGLREIVDGGFETSPHLGMIAESHQDGSAMGGIDIADRSEGFEFLE